jgi:ferredoxin-NADP reductase/Na+-translocating ferredoxin:NAD+ oxidoreductase RnfD subunit
MITLLDNVLNRVTMYRLVLYYVIFLAVAAVALAFLGFLPFQPLDLLVSVSVLVFVCWIANGAFAKLFRAPANTESLYITAFILALIITPRSASRYWSAASAPVVLAGVSAMASKYILAFRRKHIFNPAAVGVALTALTLNQPPSWWVGTFAMMPFVLVGGLLVARKLARFDLILSFLAAACAVTLGASFAKGTGVLPAAGQLFADSPILFFAFAMLTEPLTTPPARARRIAYGTMVGFLFAPFLHFGRVYLTPELALLAGNAFSHLASPKARYLLELKARTQLAPDIYDLRFASDRRLRFRPGQYLEWTLGHLHPDSRGNRRYFTIASSTDEPEVRIGVKVYPGASSFKRSLLAMRPGDEIVASQLAGEFVLPANQREKLVFMAGGIGITPFRSMIRYLLDRNERRPITVFYSNRTAPEIVYADVLEDARKELGIRTVYTLTDPNGVPPDWQGGTGRVDAEMITKTVPDYRERTFYLSGPRSLVVGFEEVLRKIGIPKNRIKTDFFPGFA